MRTITEITVQTASLVGQVIADLTYSTLKPGQFEVKMRQDHLPPVYKHDGFFVFSNLRNGTYQLQISGKGFQPTEYPVDIPAPELVLDSKGDNELWVAITAIDNTENTVSFEPAILTREIRAGARVISVNDETTLADSLPPGRRYQARLSSIAGLSVGDIIRIIRDRSLRLKYSPYYRFENPVTQIVGQVSRLFLPAVPGEAPVPLPGAKVKVTRINDQPLNWTTVQQVDIASVDINGTRILLGTLQDLETTANARGDYHLYFDKERFIKEEENNGSVIRTDLLEKISLSASLPDYQDAGAEVEITSGKRKPVHFQLALV